MSHKFILGQSTKSYLQHIDREALRTRLFFALVGRKGPMLSLRIGSLLLALNGHGECPLFGRKTDIRKCGGNVCVC
jgi:hypothetical protein